MKILLAQGNPETKYTGTRHNIGFWLIDEYAHQHDLSWQEKPKFNSLITETTIGDEKVLLVKPTTYYNETGRAARALIDYYKLEAAHDILVVHDDIALALGTLRVRQKGSDAGNNGIKSLNAHLGPDYARLRVGIWTPHRNNMHDVDFVLSTFTTGEREILADVKTIAATLFEQFIQGSLESTTYSVLPVQD